MMRCYVYGFSVYSHGGRIVVLASNSRTARRQALRQIDSDIFSRSPEKAEKAKAELTFQYSVPVTKDTQCLYWNTGYCNAWD